MLFLGLTKMRFIPPGIRSRCLVTATSNWCKPNLYSKEPPKDALPTTAIDVKMDFVKEAERMVAAINAAKEAKIVATKDAAKDAAKEATKDAQKVAAALDSGRGEVARAIVKEVAKEPAKDAEKVTKIQFAKEAAKEAAKETSKVTATVEAARKAARNATTEAIKVSAATEAARKVANDTTMKAAKEATKESAHIVAAMQAKKMATTMMASKETVMEAAKEAKGAGKPTAKVEAATAATKKPGNAGAKQPPKEPPQQPPQEKKAPRWKDFRVYRWNPEDPSKPAGLQTFKLDLNECGHMVLDALFKIKNDIDPTFTFRRSCREGICGSCSMNINGVNTLACTTAIDQSSKPTTVYPLPHMYVVRDLVVDMSQFYAQYHYIEPWLQRNDEDELKKANREVIQAPEDRLKVEMPTGCILCACCTTACPTYWWHNDKFLGPAAILNAYRWVIDSRDQKTQERLEKLNDKFKVLTCHSIWNCTKTCPKGLNPAETVHKLRLMIVGMAKKETPKVPKGDYKPKTLAELKEK